MWTTEEQPVQEPQPVSPLDCIFAIHLEATVMAPALTITLCKYSATYTVTYTITESQPQSITQSIHSHTHSQCHTVIYNHIVRALDTQSHSAADSHTQFHTVTYTVTHIVSHAFTQKSKTLASSQATGYHQRGSLHVCFCVTHVCSCKRVHAPGP